MYLAYYPDLAKPSSANLFKPLVKDSPLATEEGNDYYNTDAKTNSSVGIKQTQGNVIGGKIEGSGNIAGEEINYTVKGNVININNPSKEALAELRKTFESPAEVSLQKSEELEKRINEILNLLRMTDNKAGTHTKEIEAGELHFHASIYC